MTKPVRDPTIKAVVALLANYSFDSGELTIEQLLDQWLRVHSVDWVRLALVEALYQGRYKAVSVTQILAFWQRRDQPSYRFDPEFEQLVCNQLPKKLPITGPQQLDTPASVIEAETSQAEATQVDSDNQLLHQSRPSLSTLSFEVTSKNSPARTNPMANPGDSQTVHSEPPLSNLMMRQLSKVLSSSAQVKSAQSQLAANDGAQSIWSEFRKYSIHRFTPTIETSSFQTKLSAIAQRLR